MRIADRLLELLFPDACVGCGRSGSLLCCQCVLTLPPAPMPERYFIRSAYSYADPRMRKLVWCLKYQNGKRVARILAPAMADALAEYAGEERWFIPGEHIVLVPIPLSRERRKFRGYNQAELLAREVQRSSTVPVIVEPRLLQKTVHTQPQARIGNRAERLRNLDGVFAAPECCAPLCSLIVLIDDVSTTGATLESARNVLLQNGYARVIAITAAH